MSLLTLFCCVDVPAQVPALLAAEFLDCRVAVVDSLDQLSRDGVAVAIATASWLTTGEQRSFCDRFPQALVVVLDSALPLAAQPSPARPRFDNPEPLYRRLPYPGTNAELVFTVAAALKHYRQGQQLKLSNVALEDAHRQLDVLQRRMSALMVQLDWGVASASDRAQTEQALRRSRRRLAEAQRIAQLGSWEFDLASQTSSWSAEMFCLYGLDPAQGVPNYEQWRQTIPPEDWLPLEAAIGQAIAVGASYEVEHRIVRPDGSVRYILGRGEAVHNDQGQVVQLRGTGQDRTEARLAELALRQSEAKNQAILSAVPDLMVVVSARGQYLDFAVNGFTGDILPILLDSVGEHVTTLLPPSVAHQWQTAIARTLATGIPQFFEQQMSFGDRLQYEVVRMVPYQADQVLVLVRDVSDRQTALQERLKAERALEQAEERYRRATQAARAGVWELNLATFTGYLDPNLKALMGYRDDEIGNSLDQWFTLVQPQDRDQLAAAIQACIRGETAEFVFEYRMLHRDSPVIWVLSRGQLRRNAQGQPETFLGTTTDITPLKQVELALKQLNEELEQRVQQRTQALQTLAAVVENSTDLIGTVSLDGVALYLNRAGQRLMGLEHQPLAGRSIKSFLSAAAMAQFEQEALPTLMAEGVWQGETTFCHAQTGAAIAVEQVMFLVKDPDTHTPLSIATICRDIRDRKRSEAEHRRAELAIKASEERFRATFEQAAVGMAQVNLEGRFVEVNQTFCDLVGYSPAELGCKSYADITHPADLQEDLDNVVRLLAGEATSFTMEKRYLCRDRTIVWVNLAVALVRDGAGQPEYFIGVINDVTQRKRAELALRESQQFNQRITESTPYIIYIYDLDTHTNLYANRELTHTLGYPLNHIQVLGEELLATLVHPDDFAGFGELFDRVRAAADGDVMEMEYRMRHADGSWRWLYDRVAVFKRDDQGQAVQSIGIGQDITERKQAQLDLRESRNMLRLVLDTIPQRVFWKDKESRFLGCNPAFASDYHLTPEQVIGNTDLDLPWTAYADCYRADDAVVMATKTPKLGSEELTQNANGDLVWLRTSKIPLTNTQGQVIGVLGCYEDITTRKQVEASLLQLNQQLEQRVQERTWELEQAVQVSEAANQAKSTFLANMSHELRTPLNAILGFAQLMARDATLSGDHGQALHIINRSGEHLLMLINDILEMAKIEAGQVSLNAVRFDLHALINALGDMLHLRAQNKGLRLVLDCHPTLPRYFVADEPKLRQVLINLLGNAIKFTPAGQVTLRVTPAQLALAPPPGALLVVTFAVVDTGIGITAADRDRLFEPFVQLSQGAGTGLGLSISRQFVQMLGSDITVESQPGEGSTFAFTLTMQVADGVDSETPSATTPVTGLAAGQPSYRILVVDDESTHRHLLGELLRAVGFEVREADNGQAALDLWQQWRPQLIWLDMRMPTLSGPETARALRAQEQGMAAAPTKIIALTANAFEDDRACALASGCDDFVRKPFQFDHVLAKLAEHLGVKYSYGLVFAPLGNAVGLPAEAAIAQLRTLPPQLLVQLQQAAVQLDGDRLTQLMTQISPEQKALIDWLSWQIDEFAFDILHAQLEEAQRQ